MSTSTVHELPAAKFAAAQGHAAPSNSRRPWTSTLRSVFGDDARRTKSAKPRARSRRGAALVQPAREVAADHAGADRGADTGGSRRRPRSIEGARRMPLEIGKTTTRAKRAMAKLDSTMWMSTLARSIPESRKSWSAGDELVATRCRPQDGGMRRLLEHVRVRVLATLGSVDSADALSGKQTPSNPRSRMDEVRHTLRPDADRSNAPCPAKRRRRPVHGRVSLAGLPMKLAFKQCWMNSTSEDVIRRPRARRRHVRAARRTFRGAGARVEAEVRRDEKPSSIPRTCTDAATRCPP